jgi:alkaline phosphatase
MQFCFIICFFDSINFNYIFRFYFKILPVKKVIYSLSLISIWILLTSQNKFNPDQAKQCQSKKVKNVILMIGDGMGLAQLYAAYTVNFEKLNIFQLPYTGISLTSSADRYITDSAAGATAISTGEKTDNRKIAIDTAGKPLKTILEIAEEHGVSTGIVVTCSVTHATPAAFIAHSYDRNMHEQIALDFMKTDIDVFIGGGCKYFIDRTDKRNLVSELRRKNYQVMFSLDSMNYISSGKLAVLVPDSEIPAIKDKRGDMLYNASNTALRILQKNQAGFFLMIEGSQIDWGGHDNDIKRVTGEVLDFDKAVGLALDFARKDSNTLLIVTADHETGGLSLTGGNLKKGLLVPNFSIKDHSAIPVPVFAYGPGAEEFSGCYENTEIFKKIMASYGYAVQSKK